MIVLDIMAIHTMAAHIMAAHIITAHIKAAQSLVVRKLQGILKLELFNGHNLDKNLNYHKLGNDKIRHNN